MSHYTRQTLVTYAFFEDARRQHKQNEDALLPLVLPFIAGKAGDQFSAEVLARELTPLFGSDIVLHMAEAIVRSLEKEGYLQKEFEGPEGSIYVYTAKTNSKLIDSSFSKAEREIDKIIDTLYDYIEVSKTIKSLTISRQEVKTRFIDWITTTESPINGEGFQEPIQKVDPAAVNATLETPEPVTNTEEAYLKILFSSFILWLSRERTELFEQVATFAEIGLIIDVISEIRYPARPPKKVNLSIVLDSTVLLDLLGMCGPPAQSAAQRLLELCRAHSITATTLAHLVDEVDEIARAVVNSRGEFRGGSVGNAIQKYEHVEDLIRRVHQSPDARVRACGVTIYPHTQISDVNAKRHFADSDIQKFTNALPYHRDKELMAKRDAWSLAYAMRKRNGFYTANLYEAKCIVITKSPPFAGAAKRFVRAELDGYPGYAAPPVMEMRHFSTMFMLAFGSGESRKVVRAELVASCDRIIRVSPGLTKRIRDVLRRVETYSESELDDILSDPATMAELALTTGNDTGVATIQNQSALIEAIKIATIKDEQLRSKEAQDILTAKYRTEIDATEIKTLDASQRADVSAQEARRLTGQVDTLAKEIAEEIESSAKTYWTVTVTVVLVLGVLSVIDIFADLSSLGKGLKIAIAALLAALFAYSLLTDFLPKISPIVLRSKIVEFIAKRRLARLSDLELRQKVLESLHNHGIAIHGMTSSRIVGALVSDETAEISPEAVQSQNP